MMIMNMTPHAIKVQIGETEIHTFNPSGMIARVESKSGEDLLPIDGIPVRSSPTFGPVVGLPAMAPDTVFIVSAMVLARCKGRMDVFGPDTGPDAVRRDGQIVAVRRLLRAEG